MTTMLDEFGKSIKAGKFFIDVVAIYCNTPVPTVLKLLIFQSVDVLLAKLLDDDLAIFALAEAMRIYRLSDVETLSIASVLFHLENLLVNRSK